MPPSREYTLNKAAEENRINSELFNLLAWKMERLEKQLRETQRGLQETRKQVRLLFVFMFILASCLIARLITTAVTLD